MSADVGGRGRRTAALAGEWRILVSLLVGGLAVYLMWRALAPEAAVRGNPLEAAVAVDGTLALLCGAAGLVTGLAVLRRPGPVPVLRAAVALLGSAAGSVVSLAVPGSPLRAQSTVVLWPLTVALVLFVGALVPAFSRRIEAVDRARWPAAFGPDHATDTPATAEPATHREP